MSRTYKEFWDRTISILSNDLCPRRKGSTMELRQSFNISTNSVGKTRHSHGKKWGTGIGLDIDLTVLAKISPKWIRVLNVKHKTINT